MNERAAYLCVKQPKQKYRAAFHTLMAVIYADSKAQAKREAEAILKCSVPSDYTATQVMDFQFARMFYV